MLPSLETIKEERKKLSMTQKKLAAMTGVSTSMINQIESGRSKPSYDTAKKSLKFLQIEKAQRLLILQESFVVKILSQ